VRAFSHAVAAIYRTASTTNDSEAERRADALAFPSEEQRDPGERLLDSS
jgi:hypothetical protein